MQFVILRAWLWGPLWEGGIQLLIVRRFAAVTASVLITGASFALVCSTPARAQAACEDAAEVSVLPAPAAPWKGAPLRVIFAAEKPLDGKFSLIAPDGRVAAESNDRHGGPPYFWFAEVAAPAAGKWQVMLERNGAPAQCSTVTREVTVLDREPPRPTATPGTLWPIRNVWNISTENL